MTLYIVATPIGNLEDITYRAVRILREVDIVAAEDTRKTSLLLSKYGLKKPLISLRSQNEEQRAVKVLSYLDEGKDVAYCSDAGTPAISDPGSRLVEYVRGESDHKIVPVPGSSALTSLVSVAGNIGKGFVFEGFLSPKKGRREKRLKELFAFKRAFVIYESPHRVVKTLSDIKEIGQCRVVAAREMTKIYEEITAGEIKSVLENFERREKLKGEFSIVVIPENKDDNDEET